MDTRHAICTSQLYDLYDSGDLVIMIIWLYSAIKSDEEQVMVERLVGFNPSGAPLYKEVKRKIIESIRNGEWKPGDIMIDRLNEVPPI